MQDFMSLVQPTGAGSKAVVKGLLCVCLWGEPSGVIFSKSKTLLNRAVYAKGLCSKQCNDKDNDGSGDDANDISATMAVNNNQLKEMEIRKQVPPSDGPGFTLSQFK